MNAFGKQFVWWALHIRDLLPVKGQILSFNGCYMSFLLVHTNTPFTCSCWPLSNFRTHCGPWVSQSCPPPVLYLFRLEAGILVYLKILETIKSDYMGKSRLGLVLQKQSAFKVQKCTLTSTGHKEATSQQALGEDRFLCHDPCLWSQLQIQLGRCCDCSDGGRLAGLCTVHYTEKLELVFEDEGVCSWQAPVKCIFTWWLAPGGLTDRLVDSMLGYLFIWIHSGL